MSFETLFNKQEPGDFVAVTFQVPVDIQKAVLRASNSLQVSQSAVWRALAMDALPRLQKAIEAAK